MKRILIRAGKSPDTILSAETTLAENTIGANSGNFLFSYAAYRMLSRSDVELVPFGLGAPTISPEMVNAEFDHLVLPMANSFRPGYIPSLEKLTSFIKKLEIPVTVLSVGAQATTAMDPQHLRPLDGPVKDFVGAVLDHSPRIGVRGAFTATYLSDLGFRDVEAIGCPSMFLKGPQLDVSNPSSTLNYDSRVSFSVTPRVEQMGPITTTHLARFPNLRLIPQDAASLGAMLWGSEPKRFNSDSELPFHPQHPLFLEDKARFFVDPAPWIEYLKTIDFAFGDRIHGNVAALLAGTPAFLLAHDSRVLELAEHHRIPHVLIDDVEPDMDALDFAGLANMAPLRKRHSENWRIFARYLADQDLQHTFDTPEALTSFDASVAAAAYPPAVRSITAAPSAGVLFQRLQWLYGRLSSLESREKTYNKTMRQLEQSQASLVSLQTHLDKQSERIANLERSLQQARANVDHKTLWSDVKPRLRTLKKALTGRSSHPNK